MADEKSPLDSAIEHALDLLVFAPVGLALTAGEELPRLAAKGRQRITGQVALARLVGQFAVTQGQREARRQVERLVKQAAERLDRLGAPRAPATGPVGRNGGGTRRAPSVATSESRTMVAPVADLAIPGYDTLSASQVVQRLGGLSAGELEAVRGYEQGTRRRRTILSRVAQLQSTAPGQADEAHGSPPGSGHSAGQ